MPSNKLTNKSSKTKKADDLKAAILLGRNFNSSTSDTTETTIATGIQTAPERNTNKPRPTKTFESSINPIDPAYKPNKRTEKATNTQQRPESI